ncbi:MAG: M48 family metallopeptidase, partial [Halobacteria archaeon]|nr:M48 family metallopeptidase [Halobacteria archaeon]
MNFFEAQERARRRTGWLVLLFALATTGLIVITNLLLLGILTYGQTGEFIFSPMILQQQFDWDIFIGVAIVVSILIFLGSLYKTMSLSEGGRSVAEMLGGRLIARNTSDPDERRLLNVVEEMSIASGISVPNVYLLDETSINAFAAGLTPNDVVIGVTQGTLRYLSRDELQGVIAHEFSHIFNGDMRMNIRLIGVLHGILLLGLIGYYILRATRYVRGSRNKEGASAIAIVLALGAGLVAIGYIGFFFGQWIKAMVSRQREFLADASAVQFTRNKEGIAGALKKIGGLTAGSYLENPSAPQYSHDYFSQGVGGFLQSLFETHPPLKS